MSVIEWIHGGYVHNRRVRVLARELSLLLPDHGRILDVGCGDGLLASLIQNDKPGTSLTGIDVLVRNDTHIPVENFDGKIIPFSDASFDVLMFVDVLHHTEDPAALLREAARVARHSVIIKDHMLEGFAAAPTLRLMDRVGNLRHNIALPHNYWPKQKWLYTFASLGLTIKVWKSSLGLYPRLADMFFGRSLHFIAQAVVRRNDSVSRS
jgi:ubiquinone/menaquinone biosynthesis C-methylase UbiE